MKNLNNLCQNVIAVVKKVGDFIRSETNNVVQSIIQNKGFNDLVSYVDQQAEQMLVNELSHILPKAGYITEEGTTDIRTDEYNWIIDPLDGTTNYLHKLPIYSISVALTQHNRTVLGIVYEINKNECFHAIDGGKAYCNGHLIEVSQVTSLSESLLATGFPYYDFEKMNQYLEILKKLMQSTHGLRRLGSAAVDLAYVACGRFEGFFEYNLNVWDVAAGAFIVQQAGGKVTDFSGGDDYLFGREIVAGNLVQPHILSIIKKYWN